MEVRRRRRVRDSKAAVVRSRWRSEEWRSARAWSQLHATHCDKKAHSRSWLQCSSAARPHSSPGSPTSSVLLNNITKSICSRPYSYFSLFLMQPLTSSPSRPPQDTRPCHLGPAPLSPSALPAANEAQRLGKAELYCECEAGKEKQRQRISERWMYCRLFFGVCVCVCGRLSFLLG